MYKSICMAVVVSMLWMSHAAAEKIEVKSPFILAFEEADVTEDGLVTRAEFDIYTMSMFHNLDQDGSNFLIPDECGQSCFSADNNNTAQENYYAFMIIDADSNDRIAEAEYAGYSIRQFKNYDTNADDKLGKDEFYAFYLGLSQPAFMAKNKQ